MAAIPLFKDTNMAAIPLFKDTNMAAIPLFKDTNTAATITNTAVTSRENTL